MSDLTQLTLAKALEGLSAKTFSSGELTQAFVDAIEAANPSLNAFVLQTPEKALDMAKASDTRRAKGEAGKLDGAPLGIKDLFCTKGVRSTACSHILGEFTPTYESTVTQNLWDEGAVMLGKLNMDEFAMGSSNENSSFGPTKNPIAPERVPGGSSGGSAAAIAADTCLVSLGSDTGGSVRQPAAFCGVVGLKPTYSRISRHGLIAYASSFDQIGIFARAVEDVALMLEVIAGPDAYDSTASQQPVPAYASALRAEGKLKVAYLTETLERPGLQPEIKQQTEVALEWLRSKGHTVEAASFPLLDYVLPTYYILCNAEASTNLSRFDGVRYGYRTPEAEDLETMYKKTRSEGFGPEVQRRILLGTFVLSASYYDAYFTKAQKVRRLIKDQLDDLLQAYDLLLLPTTPTTAFELGKFGEDNLIELYLSDLFTVPASVAGLPAISLPNGTDAQGLPIGLQAIAGAFEEAKLLAFSQYWQQQHAAEPAA